MWSINISIIESYMVCLFTHPRCQWNNNLFIFWWRAPYKPSRTPLLVGRGYPQIKWLKTAIPACPVAALRADEIGLTRLWQAGWENGDCLGIWSFTPLDEDWWYWWKINLRDSIFWDGFFCKVHFCCLKKQMGVVLWTLAFTIPQRVQSSIHWKLWFQTLDAASCLGGSSFLVPQFRLKQGLKSDCCCRRLGRISVGHGTFSCPVFACSSHSTAWLPWWICSTIFSSCSSTCGAAREARLSRQWKPKHARSCISCVGRFDCRLCTTQLGRNRLWSSWLSSGKAWLHAGDWCSQCCH